MNDLQAKLGDLLRLEREQRGVSIEDMSTRLKISEDNLIAIERGDSGSMPSELYFNLFAKSYCEALGIDFTRTRDAIKLELEEKAAPPKPAKNRAESRSEDQEESPSDPLKKFGYLFGGIVVIFVVFLIVFKLFFEGSEPVQSTNSEDGSTLAAQEAQAQFGNYDWNVPAYTPPKSLQLKLIPRGESWATVVADGDTVIYRNLVPGRTYEAEAEYRLLVSIGVPRSVETELNGVAVNLADPESRRISRVYIDQLNVKKFLKPQTSETVADGE